MSTEDQGIDRELRTGFIDESLDALQQVTSLLVDLEANPDDMDAVQAIFRPVHSIKGNSAFFGMMQTKTLAHEMETVLDLVRKGALTTDANVVESLLHGMDELAAMLERTRQDEPEVLDEIAFDAVLRLVREVAKRESGSEEEQWRKLIDSARSEGLADVVSLVEGLARLSPAGRRALGIGRTAKVAGGGIRHWPEPARLLAGMLGDNATPPDAAEGRRLLELCIKDADPAEAEKIISDFDVLVRTVGLGDVVSRSLLHKHLERLFPASAEASGPESAKPAGRDDAKSRTAAAKAASETRTMRIAEERIDAFLGHVGELVTIGEMYGHVHAGLLQGDDSNAAATDLRRVNEMFDSLSLSLQHSIMQIRKVPMSGLIGRVPRMVRDIATAQGKQIAVTIEGGDILVDKSHLDVLDAPLMHMVRNAADHGVEPPAVRLEAGKPEQGTVVVRVEEDAAEFSMTVQDDGKGINRDALRDKALKLGLLSPDAVLSDADVVNLLFMPGVSTAETVSDISGRGVGMDVVRRGVEEAGGRIQVKTTPGGGTSVVVYLPKSVSTQILDGFVVVAGGTRYVFPLKMVERCFCPTAADLVPVKGKGMCVRDGEKLFRCLDLQRHLDPQAPPPDWLQGSLVVLSHEDRTVALHVDALEGVRRVVLKDLDGLDQRRGLFDGGAVMGDGRVALVINVGELLAKDNSHI